MNNRLISSLACILLLASCGGKKQEQVAPVAQTQAPKLQKVSIQIAAKQAVEQNYIYSSTVQAMAVNNIVSQTAGRIRKLNVEIGDFVSAGQILAEMDRVQLDQAALKLKNDETELQRVKALYEEGAVSQSDFESLELAYNVAKSSYENLLENTILRAPVSGVVSARNYDKGDMYTMSSPIYTVQQITPVKLLVAVSETDYTKIKKGDKVSLAVDALPGKNFSGKVVRLYPVIDPASHTFNVEIQVANSDRQLRPGMYARVTIQNGINQSIVLPDLAVLKQQGAGTRTVFVLGEDSTVSQKVVKLGLHFDGNYEILSGLDEGDKVIVKGNATLRSGDKVEVI